MARGCPTPMNPSDARGFHALVRQAQGGDRAAMDRVIEILRPRIEPLARQYAGPIKPTESTADLLQESCLRAWNKIGAFQGGEGDEETFRMFRTWIGQIVRRLGLDSRREQGRKKRQPIRKPLRLGPGNAGDSTAFGRFVEPRSTDPTPSARLRGQELKLRVREIIDELPRDEDAAVMRLVIGDGLTVSEAARELRIHPETARKRFWATARKIEHRLQGWL